MILASDHQPNIVSIIMANKIPDGIKREHIIKAIELYNSGKQHAFADSTGYDLFHEGRNYPPKAIVGIAGELVTGIAMKPRDFSGGESSKCFRILQQSGFMIDSKHDGGERGVWLFQGNPKNFDIEDYLSRYTYIYWRIPKLQSAISIGDKCVIWRSGPAAGMVATGHIAEAPVRMRDAKFQDCLGEDLWREEPDSPETVKVGIQLEEVRLNEDEGFIPRSALASHPVLSGATIIRSPQETVFRLNQDQSDALLRIWSAALELGVSLLPEAMEGAHRLRQHYARERSRTLIQKKKEAFAIAHSGRVYCEVCGFDFGERYPKLLGEGFIEVHHLDPLFTKFASKKTTLDDLLLVCSNCHRMIHRTREVDANLRALREHFSEVS